MLDKTCERCDGNGTIVERRDARLEELSDAQVKTLLHADIYRESGGDEGRKQQQKAKRMQKQAQSGAQPSGTPTNVAGRSALNRTP